MGFESAFKGLKPCVCVCGEVCVFVCDVVCVCVCMCEVMCYMVGSNPGYIAGLVTNSLHINIVCSIIKNYDNFYLP